MNTGAAVIGGLGSLAGGVSGLVGGGGDGAKDMVEAQEQAAKLQKMQGRDAISRSYPWYGGGIAAQNLLLNLAGLGSDQTAGMQFGTAGGYLDPATEMAEAGRIRKEILDQLKGGLGNQYEKLIRQQEQLQLKYNREAAKADPNEEKIDQYQAQIDAITDQLNANQTAQAQGYQLGGSGDQVRKLLTKMTDLEVVRTFGPGGRYSKPGATYGWQGSAASPAQGSAAPSYAAAPAPYQSLLEPPNPYQQKYDSEPNYFATPPAPAPAPALAPAPVLTSPQQLTPSAAGGEMQGHAVYGAPAVPTAASGGMQGHAVYGAPAVPTAASGGMQGHAVYGAPAMPIATNGGNQLSADFMTDAGVSGQQQQARGARTPKPSQDERKRTRYEQQIARLQKLLAKLQGSPKVNPRRVENINAQIAKLQQALGQLPAPPPAPTPPAPTPPAPAPPAPGPEPAPVPSDPNQPTPIVQPQWQQLQNEAMSRFQADPGYLFRLKEGEKAILRNAAATGGAQSGANLKALARFGQDFGSNEYANWYNRMSALAGQGQVGAQNINANAYGTAANVGNAMGNAAQAQASGYANQASQRAKSLNSFASGLGQIMGGIKANPGNYGGWGADGFPY